MPTLEEEELAAALPAFRKDHPIVTALEVLRTARGRLEAKIECPPQCEGCNGRYTEMASCTTAERLPIDCLPKLGTLLLKRHPHCIAKRLAEDDRAEHQQQRTRQRGRGTRASADEGDGAQGC